MDISFTGEYVVNNGDVTFYAIANNQRVSCKVSKTALEAKANRDNDDDPETVFLDHQYKFEEIAEALLRNHKVVDGEIHITHREV